jgi:DNA-binding SARP family transcriptional activator/tetratricopeptide (TPR) repeat protein
MLVRLLGTIDLMVDGKPRIVRGLRPKALLAVLALQGGQIVSTDQLTDAAWPDAKTPATMNALQSHVSYLRGLLSGAAAIRAQAPGYVLELPEDGTDVQVAERLLREGTSAGDPVEEVRHLRAALDLWRGRPLADLVGMSLLEGHAQRLELLWMQVRQALSEAMLAAGEHAKLVPELEQMVGDHLLDEQLHGQLMLALYRTGRQADALAVYQRLRATLGDELGLDPGQQLRDLQTAILHQDPALEAPVSPARLAALPTPTPAQLPLAVPGFTGRSAELSSLDALLPRDARPDPARGAPMTIAAISGTAGVGKTALAIRWAHQVAERFPDGQLYVNLQGFEPGGTAVDPGQALRGFLEALGVPAGRIPADLAGQTGLYRSLLARKRVLIVLDNARSAEQARPLLPGSPGCLTIVTSRDQLAGLIAAEGARCLPLDLLSTADARELLTHRLGADRMAAEPEAADSIVAACARLPLALTVAAARAAVNPAFPLAAVAAELTEASSALDRLGGSDISSDVRAVFSCSYYALSDGAARLFRLLGLHPGPDISAAAAASLAAVSARSTQLMLAELTSAHLLTQHAPGRYSCHDLLRAYARELAESRDDALARDTAVRRALGHYLHTAHAASYLLKPERYPIDLAEAPPGTAPESFAAAERASAWFATEHHVLLASIRHSAEVGLDRYTWQLAWALSPYLSRGGYWHEQAAIAQTAADAARRNEDLTGLGAALCSAARACVRLDFLERAESHYRQALAVYTETGDLGRRADTCIGLSDLAGRQSRFGDSLAYSHEALATAGRAGDLYGQGLALNSVGYSHFELGEYQQAVASCREALTLLQQLAYPEGEAGTWHSLGCAYSGLGNRRQAVMCFERALELYRELGDRFLEADSLARLGDVHDGAGDTAAARRAWLQALRIHDETGHADAGLLRAKLGQSGHRPTVHASPAVTAQS